MMKYIYKLFLLFLIPLIWGCEEDDKATPVASFQQAPVLSLLNNVDVSVNSANTSQGLVPLNWSAANYDVALPITYTVEIALLGNNFSNAVEVGTTSELSFSIQGDDLNQALWDWGVFPGIEAPVEVRVVSFVDEALEEGESNAIQLNVTGFNANPSDEALLYVATQFPDYTWDWMNAPSICSPGDNGSYAGFVNVSSDNEHYFVPNAGDFKYYGEGSIAGVYDEMGEAIVPDESGYYQVSLNTNTRTYTFAPVSWGIIGSSTPGGWDSDTDMTLDPETGIWSITTDMVAGEYKFRANDDWALNYGGSNGQLAQDGANITLSEAGTYTIRIDLNGCCFAYQLESAGEVMVAYSDCAPVEGPQYTYLYLVGDATAPGWDNNSNYPIFIDPDNPNIFHYTGYFKGGGGGFKLLSSPGNWQPQYGVGATAGEVGVNEGGGSDPAAFPIPSDGYYTFTIDIEAMTYTLEAFDASGADTFTSLGLIGSGSPQGNWDADVDMTQSSFDTHIWSFSDAALTQGAGETGMKIRANDGWDVNWGGDTFPAGVGVPGGGNIGVAETGTYDVWFNDLDDRYLFIKQ